jgi:hypothetical protein
MLETNREGGASSIVSAANIFGEVLMMRRMWIFAGCVLFLSTFAMAQHRGGGMGGGTVGAAPVVVAAPHVAGVAPRVAARVSPATRVATAPVGVHHGTHVNAMTAHGNFRSGPANLPLFPTSFGNVPGLGFDYPHMAAVNSGRGRMRSDFDMPFGFGGFLLSSPGVIVEEAQPSENQPPATEESEGAVANTAGSENGRDSQVQFLPATRSAAAPVREAAEYVFVRRDGSLLFAVAYSWDNGTLRYVTRDGLRRSVTREALDMDATQQFNEQRGLSFHLPV